MPEVINISLSPQANHLATHFYNTQESYIDYSQSITKSPNDPDVHFKPTLSYDKSSSNYTPRALIWDFKGGFGSLGQFEYYQSANNDQDGNNDEWTGTIEQISSRPKINKSEYQIALDNGQHLPPLNNDSTKYWTDYSRVLFQPNSYNELHNWEYDPVEFPEGRLSLGQERKFEGYEVGVSEWKEDGKGIEFLENKYRNMLENCDGLEGLNIISELDSSWGGFSSELLRDIKDDYNPKTTIFTWGNYNGKRLEQLGNREILSRIRTFLELQRNSSIFIPMSTPQSLPSSIDPSSLWQTSALKSLVFEPFQTLVSQRENRVSLSTIADNLTLGTERRIVSNVEVQFGEENLNFADTFFIRDRGAPHTFSKSTVHKPSRQSSASDIVELSEKFQKKSSLDDDSKKRREVDKSHVDYISKIPVSQSSSFPTFLKSSDSLKTSLEITTRPKKTLQEMKTFVSRFVRGDERENMIQELEVLAEEYVFGWEDSDGSDDDY
ncbi:Tubulin beta-1 chain [Wickerhamomyces ciferrii]|uniref:Protein DML1 n=1 Tax=Wickerhamomyces ciferrii (strain ATCC 14091 / BCRC 22168 / CBS 111 / JCM 3599 / NBRC 0793 / NRRL Y-1031 F-60-10) TaxID=1206466 RepID=K0K870_WICCF|nr:Tubulin beta-1 chain [Wickerhamomyces ciferrii]CCH41020.1 Tubulin beta-1 chain [Wickerhamomyces ciferrii]